MMLGPLTFDPDHRRRSRFPRNVADRVRAARIPHVAGRRRRRGARRSCAAQEVHLLLLDMHMPRLSGLETIRRVKQFKSRLPCILLSAGLDELLIQQAQLAEAFSVLSKPVSRLQITNVVEHRIAAGLQLGPGPQLPGIDTRAAGRLSRLMPPLGACTGQWRCSRDDRRRPCSDAFRSSRRTHTLSAWSPSARCSTAFGRHAFALGSRARHDRAGWANSLR